MWPWTLPSPAGKSKTRLTRCADRTPTRASTAAKAGPTTLLYFNDCAKFAHAAKWCLRPGATALVVIGNSILQGVHIATDRFLATIAERCGLETVAIHTPRDARVGSSIVNSSVRAGSGGETRLYESIVELRQQP